MPEPRDLPAGVGDDPLPAPRDVSGAPTLTGDDPPPIIAPDDSALGKLVNHDRQKPDPDLPADSPPAEPKQLSPPVAEAGVRIDPAVEKPDEPFEPTGRASVPWLTSTGRRPEQTPWLVQPNDGATDKPHAPTPIQEIPLVRCPSCKSNKVHKYGRSKLPDGGRGMLYYYQCQNCTDPRTGYALTRFRVRHF